MLFMPPRPPVRLVVGQPCVLGRSPSCDLPIPSGGASRRHAHVCWERDGIVIRDLSSTNGTFINGEKLEGARLLQAGDRIMIGDRTVTFCQVGPALGGDKDAPGDTDTLSYATAGPAEEDAFQGDFSEIPAFAVLQVLEMGMKSGLVEITRGAETQRIWFHCGMPVHAVAGGLDGIDAAVFAVRPIDGRFAFRAGVRAPTRTIHVSLAELLLEASRRMDEGKR
jgi:pSer/pThr/pTyr-binding forkhead associated (FHA) protein